jgi:PAS domain S-box-containing protein
MPSALAAMDTDMRVLHWNREAENLFGTGADRAMGRKLEEILPNEKDLPALVRQALERSAAASMTNRMRRTPSGTLFQDITAYPLRDDRCRGVVIRMDDVTRRVGMERMLIQSEKMVSMGGLAAGMAHEINNPLAGMMQNAQVILNRLSASLPVNQAVAAELGTTMEVIHGYMERRDILKFLESIHGAGTHAARIVQNMLNFSRKSTSDKSHHPAAALLEKTLELAAGDYNLKKRFDFKKIRIIREYDPAPIPLLCEAANLQQVFFNIVRNAAEAMQDGTSDGSPPTLTLRLKADGTMALVEIHDNGPGMDEETRHRVFEPFFTTKDPDRGTGLGLSVSYFIVVQDHGGTLEVDSAPGRGTTFRIRLPMALAAFGNQDCGISPTGDPRDPEEAS